MADDLSRTVYTTEWKMLYERTDATKKDYFVAYPADVLLMVATTTSDTAPTDDSGLVPLYPGGSPVVADKIAVNGRVYVRMPKASDEGKVSWKVGKD